MFEVNKKMAKIFFCVGAATFLLFGFFGLLHFNMQMGMDGNASASNCPFMVGMSLCTMTPFEHISVWQNMFGNIPIQKVATAILLFAVSLVFGFLLTKKINSPPKHLLALRKYLHFQEYVPTIHSLQELFSNGILNPKTF
jgi:hypothetical protein